MKKIGLLGALRKLGCRDIELHWGGGPASRDQSGFFVGGGQNGFKDGQMYYVSYKPAPLAGLPPVMYRKAENKFDFSGKDGEYPQWDFCDKLAELKYEMDGKALPYRSKRYC